MLSYIPVLASLLASQVVPVSSRSEGLFVTTSPSGRFLFNGTEFPLVGTTAYWLPSLLDEEDISFTLGNISQAGFNAVRIWAFNDVDTVPEDGTWFQHIDSNGTVTINNGTNGLQKLDTVVRVAEKHKIFLILSLTNNWNPLPPSSNASNTKLTPRWRHDPVTVQRNFLSNQYGGMDVYVRQLAKCQEHDQFYVDKTLVGVYKDYITQVVSRYKNSPYVLSWEIANDPRCDSSVSASDSCSTLTVTKWHAKIAQHISRVDPNHLISSGGSGFLCADCPKLYQNTTSPAQSSPAARRGLERLPRASTQGRWSATVMRRQSEHVGNGTAFNGATGVDSEDILSIPEIKFGSFHLFPDQFTYGLAEPSGPLTPNASLAVGLDWIKRQSQASARVGKPVVLTGFGLVTQNNSQFFVPFNSTKAPYGPVAAGLQGSKQQPQYGVTDQQADQTFTEWIKTAFNESIAGISYHQWTQGGLKTGPGVPVQSSGQAAERRALNLPGTSPNDGYTGKNIWQVLRAVFGK